MLLRYIIIIIIIFLIFPCINGEVCTRRDLGLDTNYPNLPINHDCDVINLKTKSNDKKDSLKFKDIQIIVNLLQKYYYDDNKNKYDNKNNNDNIKTLILKNNFLDDQSIKLIAHLISSGVPPLLNIDLVATNISPLGLQLLSYSLRSDSTTIASIDLRSNDGMNDKKAIKHLVRSVIIKECQGATSFKIMNDLKKWPIYIEQDRKSLFQIGDLISKRINDNTLSKASWVSSYDSNSFVEKEYGYIKSIAKSDTSIATIKWVNSNRDFIGESEESICFLDLEERYVSLDHTLTLVEVIIPASLPDSNKKLISISMIENTELPQLKSKVWLTIYEINDKLNDEDIDVDGLSRHHKRIGLKRYSATDLDWFLDIYHHNTNSNKFIVECKGCDKTIKFDLRVIVNDESYEDEEDDDQDESKNEHIETKKVQECGSDKECKKKSKKPKTANSPRKKNKIFSWKPSILLLAIKDYVLSQIPPMLQFLSSFYRNFSNAATARRQKLINWISEIISKLVDGILTHYSKIIISFAISLSILLSLYTLKTVRKKKPPCEEEVLLNLDCNELIDKATDESNDLNTDPTLLTPNIEVKNEKIITDDKDDTIQDDEDTDDASYTDKSHTDRSYTDDGSFTDRSYTNDSYDDNSYGDEYDVEDNLTAASTVDDNMTEMDIDDNDIESIISEVVKSKEPLEVVKIKDPSKEKLTKRKSTLQWIAYTLYHTVPDADTSMLTDTIRKEQLKAAEIKRTINSTNGKTRDIKKTEMQKKTKEPKKNIKANIKNHKKNDDDDDDDNDDDEDNSDSDNDYDKYDENDEGDDNSDGDSDDDVDDVNDEDDDIDNGVDDDNDESDDDNDDVADGIGSINNDDESDIGNEETKKEGDEEIEGNVENDETWKSDKNDISVDGDHDENSVKGVNNDVNEDKDSSEVESEEDEDNKDYKKHMSMSEFSDSDSSSSSYSSSESSIKGSNNNKMIKKDAKNIKIAYQAPPIPPFNRKKLFRLDEKRRRLTIGKIMLPRIEYLQPYIAGEIIALLIQMDTEDLIILLESPETLDKVVASAATLFYNKKKEMKILKEKEKKEKKEKKKKSRQRKNDKNCTLM